MQRPVVPIGGIGSRLGQRRRGVVQLALSLRHTGSARQELSHRLTRAVRFLPEPSDGRRRRREPHLTAVERDSTRGRGQQRRFADAVGPDDAEPLPRSGEQTDVIEDRTGTSGDGDVVEP